MGDSINCEITCDELQVGRSGQKKKARMARTRSDFLTRAPILSVGGDTDEEDADADADSPLSPHSPRHYTLPLPSQSSTEADLRESCFSDSDMVTGSRSRPGGGAQLLCPISPLSPSFFSDVGLDRQLSCRAFPAVLDARRNLL